MSRLPGGSFHLFRVAGIDVFLHWSWLVVAFFEIQFRVQPHGYASAGWAMVEYVTLFGIVLLHELGHALACRQVGGTAKQIVLWPLGGVAFVSPPARPGAVLWSIAAGPLVNLALVPVSLGVCAAAGIGVGQLFPIVFGQAIVPDLPRYLATVAVINLGLLVFNLFPVYPLDGGQIVQALLWFVIGRARSLLVVSILGLTGAGALLFLALAAFAATRDGGNILLVLIAGFVALRSWAGVQQARVLTQIHDGPRHKELTCPSCGNSPPKGELWACDRCHTRFDTFQEGAVCPWCGARFLETACPHCHHRHPIAAWYPKVLPVDPAGEDVTV